MIPFEKENTKAYVLLLRIEIVLRECIRTSMEIEFGANWQKRLPGDLFKKIKESQTEENRPQFNFVRLGPLYYLTFGELLTILTQKLGHSVAKKFGGDCFLKQLENILVPRNALCHSRPISSVGLRAIETLYAEMKAALTAEELSKLTAKLDTGLTQDDVKKMFMPALLQVLSDLPKLPGVFTIPKYFRTAIAQFWWADDNLAGFNRSIVETAFTLLHQYNTLPKGVGSAGIRQNFCDEHSLKIKIEDAIIELEKMTL